MVPAGAQIDIPVSCVEAGRWAYCGGDFRSANRTQFASGRARKLAQVSDALRIRGTRVSDQGDVWNEVAAKASKMSARSPTSAMAEIFDHSQGYLDAFVERIPRVEGQVGAIFSINGQIAGMDAFDSTATFEKMAPKLVRSYALDTLEKPLADNPPRVSVSKIRHFLDEIAQANVESFKAVGLGDDLRFNRLGLAGAALQIADKVLHMVAFPMGGVWRPQRSSHRIAHIHLQSVGCVAPFIETAESMTVRVS